MSEDESKHLIDTKRIHRKCVETMVHEMEPLLHDFLIHTCPYIPPSTLHALRVEYLPEMILAYLSGLHCAGYMSSREHLLQCMDLSTNIASNDRLIECFKAAQSPAYRRRGGLVAERDNASFGVLSSSAGSDGSQSVLTSRPQILRTPSAVTAAEGEIGAGDDGYGNGRLKEFVDGIAAASKAILKLNEMGGIRRSKQESKVRGNKGQTLAIWDVTED